MSTSKIILIVGTLLAVGRVVFAPKVLMGEGGRRVNAARNPEFAVVDTQVLAIHLMVIVAVTAVLWYLTKDKKDKDELPE